MNIIPSFLSFFLSIFLFFFSHLSLFNNLSKYVEHLGRAELPGVSTAGDAAP